MRFGSGIFCSCYRQMTGAKPQIGHLTNVVVPSDAQAEAALNFFSKGLPLPPGRTSTFAVLEHALEQLYWVGRLSKPPKGKIAPPISDLMKASVAVVPWVNYNLVDEARDRRNDMAHRQQWIDVKDCERYFTAISAELRAWGIT